MADLSTGPTGATNGEQVACLDLRGEVCPYTLLRCKLAIEELSTGTHLRICVDHRPAFTSLPRALRSDGHTVTDVSLDGNVCWIEIAVNEGSLS